MVFELIRNTIVDFSKLSLHELMRPDIQFIGWVFTLNITCLTSSLSSCGPDLVNLSENFRWQFLVSFGSHDRFVSFESITFMVDLEHANLDFGGNNQATFYQLHGTRRGPLSGCMFCDKSMDLGTLYIDVVPDALTVV